MKNDSRGHWQRPQGMGLVGRNRDSGFWGTFGDQVPSESLGCLPIPPPPYLPPRQHLPMAPFTHSSANHSFQKGRKHGGSRGRISELSPRPIQGGVTQTWRRSDMRPTETRVRCAEGPRTGLAATAGPTTADAQVDLCSPRSGDCVRMRARHLHRQANVLNEVMSFHRVSSTRPKIVPALMA